MRRLVFVFLAASCVSHATSIAFSSCTAGSTTLSPCPSDQNLMGGIIGPNYSIAAFALASESFPSWLPPVSPPIPGGKELYAEADAGGIEGYPPPPLPVLSATANASINETYYSTGPSRLGLIEFSIALGYVNAFFPGYVSVGNYSTGAGGIPPYSCGPEDCLYTATLPFNLGTRFQVAASTSAGAGFSLPGKAAARIPMQPLFLSSSRPTAQRLFQSLSRVCQSHRQDVFYYSGSSRVGPFC